MKRILSFGLALTILCTLLSFITANAATIIDSGTCGAQGDNVKWTLDSEGTLTISGMGEMADYHTFYYPPGWSKEYYDKIKKVVVQDKTTPRLIQFYTFKNAVKPPFLGGFFVSGVMAA